MPKQPLDWQRKNEHIFLAEKYYQPTNPLFDEIQLIPSGLPNLTFEQVNSTISWGSKVASSPLYINAMTGGSPQTILINQKLASLAAQLQIPMAVGSMSNYLKYPNNPEVQRSYAIVRETNQQGIIWANVSAHTNWQDAKKCVDLIAADALQVHLNSTQEIVMAEGNHDFIWLNNIQQLLEHIQVPIIIKEVGFGMSAQMATQLQQLGVQIVDISGRGGTNFAQIENTRNHQADYSFLQNFGLTTLESLLETKPLQKQMTILASGGIRSPLDVVKCLVLGAHAVGIAAPVLHILEHQSLESATQYFAKWLQQIKEIMVLLNCSKITELKQVDYRLSVNLNNFIQQKSR
ncbi:MAG: type 2 isopentenyl-diphosphate Delta-isomerase [Lactobacillus sp.]|uniref:type 2 isopentenyl-diphosphate Delta-isomerase n=1 Tax=Bombilactobacillus bombi TaxID=1303590 RepID=UPI0035EF4F71|nr:type 2 isopentenyl-diphosphate Delta-isomerase [Lactobacillus sp.]